MLLSNYRNTHNEGSDFFFSRDVIPALLQILSKTVASHGNHNELLSLGIIRTSDNILLFLILFYSKQKMLINHSNNTAVVSNVFILESWMSHAFFKTK